MIAAAVEIFWRKGYPAASIQDVANEVGMLKGSLYHYIASKEDLLWATLDRVHARSVSILEEVLALDVDPLERLRVYVERHALWYLEDKKGVTVFLREWRHLTGEQLTETKRRRRGYDLAMRRMVEAAQEDGSLRGGVDPKYASLYLLAALNAMPDWYHPEGDDPPRRIAESYADMAVGMLRGLGSRDGDLRLPQRRAA